MIAANLRKRRPKPHTIWHLDEGYLKIDGRMVYLWRAVDAEGEVIDALVQPKRNKAAALKLMRKLLKKYAFVPARMITDDLRSYGALPHANSGLKTAMRAVDGRTTALKTRISQLGQESARCKASRVRARHPFPPEAER
jgi:transposase-like protein